MNQIHEFAIYAQEIDLSILKPNQTLIIKNEIIYHRIVRILRLQTDDNIILFNRELHCTSKIIEITKNSILLKVIQIKKNTHLKPKITILISLLKKESFEEAIYFCCEFGSNVIQPIITQKIHQKKLQEKDKSRLENIIISAAEQSKNFNFPELKEPITLSEITSQLKSKNLNKIFFDADGEKFNFIKEKIILDSEFFLMIGPEGDLTQEEKLEIKNSGFIFCALTPTILRSQTAVSLSLGMFRALF